MPIIKFEVGDVSGDGHGLSAQYLVQTNRSADELRELHFGQDAFIGGLCEEFQDHYIALEKLHGFLEMHRDSEWVQQELIALTDGGLKSVTLLDKHDRWIQHPTTLDIQDMSNRLCMDDSDGMLHTWLLILRGLDPSLETSVLTHGMSKSEIQQEGYPHPVDGSMYTPSTDRVNRRISPVGYGVWRGDEDDYGYGMD